MSAPSTEKLENEASTISKLQDELRELRGSLNHPIEDEADVVLIVEKGGEAEDFPPFRGIIKGEMLRFKRCTHDPVDLQTQYALFSERLIKRGYPKNEIKTVMQEVTAKQRNDTLMLKPKSVLQSPPLVFSTVFSRQKSHIKNNILKHWDKLKDDEEAKLLFDKRPLFAFRRHKNLKDTVTLCN
ncbi:unnamed protein product [Mytilus coruscus]|uniref:Uncharacterized protein n=1 Tax=Mytilus coruscus TaxID=42192 RepID=A0A6J8CCQ7_MYTCO|nr:unnamed protein product [Mytilus coruscus]